MDALPGHPRLTTESSLPLSSKNVPATADLAAAVEMANDERLAAFARETFRWTQDPEKYEALRREAPAKELTKKRPRQNATCRLSKYDVEIQIGLHKYEKRETANERNAEIEAWCRVFSVPEWAKKRRRHICEPLVNDLYTDTPTVRLASRAERADIIEK
jgi:hypothetical protein